MSWSRISQWTIAAMITSVVTGQQSGWRKGQANATMCQWRGARAATVRDTAYVDGGYLYWVPGMVDGTYGAPTQDGNPLGLIYSLNFSTPFNTTSNISEIMQTISKAPNGDAANNLAPNFYDGAMLANDDEFLLYGGLMKKSDALTPPHSDDILGYSVYQYGIYKDSWRKGFFNNQLPQNMTRYLTFGGAANAPSENKAYYFGGMRSPIWGDIFYPTLNATLNPTNVSNTLITLDMTTQEKETWKNVSLLDDGVEGRANPELVWVPVGAEGILVALGGVTYPDYDNGADSSQNEQQSKIDSPSFMSTIDIYDVAGNKWYKQNTVAGPGQLALGCAVVAVAQDQSSYNIYYYGGYNGVDPTSDFNDDVWVLSLPSFMWVKLSPGTSDHGRAGHKCVKPYPDQMIVIGGFPKSTDNGNPGCVKDGILQVFNLTDGKWMQSYDPAIYNEYGVPEMIHLKIGGDAAGGATMTIPTPTGWTTPNLAKVFQTPYPTSKLTKWYPYASPVSNSTRPDITTTSSSGTPSWVAPVLGVVLGLVFVSAVVVAILLCRRRNLLRKRGTTEGSTTNENGNRILSWIHGQDINKAPTVTTDETPTHTDDIESRVGQPIQSARPDMTQVYPSHEMPDTPLVELMDTSPPIELGDTGLTPIDVINKHSHFANARGTRSTSTPTNPSSYSRYTVSQDHASISSNSQTQSRGFGTPALDAVRPDSPPPGTTKVTPPQPDESSAGNSGDPRIVSDLSGISERDQAHLRNISDVSANDAAGTLSTLPPTPTIGQAGLVVPPGPVSPPSAGADGVEAPDYISVQRRSMTDPGIPGQQAASPLRRSVFSENKDDLGEHQD